MPTTVLRDIDKLEKEVERLKLEISGGRLGLRNAESTFGVIKYGKPSGKLIVPVTTDRSPPDIDEENWFFMTGTLWKNPHIHTDRCGVKCTGYKHEDK